MSVKKVSPEQLGRRIRKLRLERKLSQEDLAEPDYTAAYVSQLEHGKRRASEEALAHIARRLGMTPEQLISGRDPDEDLRLEVMTQAAVADVHKGRAEDALVALEEIRGRAEVIGNRDVVRAAQIATGQALYRLGRIEEALATYERVFEAAADAHAEQRTSAVTGRGRCLFHLGEVRAAVHLLETHLIELQRSSEPDPSRLVEVYAALIPGYFETGMMEHAKDVATKGWELAPSIPNPEAKACLYVNRAQLMATQGHPREALTSLALAEDIYRHLGWFAEMIRVALARSFVLTEQGKLPEAERLVRDALEQGGPTVDRGSRIRALSHLAHICRELGAPQEGLDLALQSLELAGDAFTTSAAEAEREAGLCALELGDPEQAVQRWRRALAGFKQAGDRDEALETARLLGDRLAEEGDLEGAAAAYRDGLT